jgi:hypothetical protein
VTPTTPDHSWLPDHQLHVVETLGHADELLGRMADIVFDYLSPPGPFALETRAAAGGQAQVRVATVAPLPAAVSRYAAAALTALRGAVEHALYGEVEAALGRELSDNEGRQVEVPAAVTPRVFDDWVSNRRRPQLQPLQRDGVLVDRLRGLQPFHSTDPDSHPLRLLAVYTNYAKHRTPAVAATRLGAVIPDHPAPGLEVAAGPGLRPLAPGDVIASGPKHVAVPLSIWPELSLRRPHTGTWHMLIRELGNLSDWVRTVAVPRIVVGTDDVEPLPPQIDTTVGHADVRAAMRDADGATATARYLRRLHATMAREGLVDILAVHPERPDPATLTRWVASLTDDEVLERRNALPITSRLEDLPAVDAAARRLLAEAGRHDDCGGRP